MSAPACCGAAPHVAVVWRCMQAIGWFEHDQRSVAQHVQMSCAHLDQRINAETRHRKLRSIIDGLDVPVITSSRYCVWLQCSFTVGINTGVLHVGRAFYSIEESGWQLNYCCDIGLE